VRFRSEDVRSFVDAYEEKMKIISEIESLKIRARKGKIPRRRYRVRRKTLETRLNTLFRNLSELKEKISAAGGSYRDLMRRLEVAETEINEIKANITSIEARHRRGELSLGAYRKLLGDYERRREEAETTINGILIRLRE
jgi:chromosome segregation ATPase